MTSNVPDQTRPTGRVLADLFGILLMLAGFAGIAYAAFSWSDIAGIFVCSVYAVLLGAGLATDTSSG